MEERSFHKNTKDDVFLNIADLIRIVVKNWKWFVFSFILFLGGGIFYILMKNPVHEVDALVLLREDDKKSGASGLSMSMSKLASFSDLGSMMGSKNIDNEVVVFNTRKIMRQSLMSLNLHVKTEVWDNLRKIDPYPFVPFNITVDSTDVTGMEFELTFTIKPIGDNKYNISGEYDNEKFKVTTSLPNTIKTPILDVHIEKNQFARKEDKDKTVDVTVYNPNILAVMLNEDFFSIDATSKKTTIIRIATETDNIKWAQDLIYKIIDFFNNDAIEDKNMIANLTAGFVNDRLSSLEEELSVIERQMEAYKQENRLTDIESDAEVFLEQMGEFEKSRIETRIQLNMIQYIEEYVKDKKNQNNFIPAIGIEDKGLLASIANYNELLAERNKTEQSSTDSNPALMIMNSQLISMRQNIAGNINNIVNSMQIALGELDNQDFLNNARISLIPRQEREYIEIRRQQEIKSALYSYLLQKGEETNLNLASTTPKAKVIDEPMPGIEPVAPKKMIVLLIALCLGVMAPLMIFYAKKILKTEIDSKEELEAISEVEIIGDVCKGDPQEKIVVKSQKTTSSVELFRLLRANLSFILGNNSSEKVILVTSTVSGEGKTYISINLAASLALIEKRVLVVGLDIRNPKLADYLDKPRGIGITNYLTDNSLSATDIIQHSGVHPNLDIIQAGPIPPNPNELLLKSRLDELFVDLRKKYDYIILDTAPVGLVSDTFLLNRISDVSLYVVRIGVAHKDSVNLLNSINRNGKLKKIYVIANGVELKDKNGGYGYGYGQTK